MPLTDEQRRQHLNSLMEQAAQTLPADQLASFRSIAEANPQFFTGAMLAQNEASRLMSQAQAQEAAARAAAERNQQWYATAQQQVEAANQTAARATAQAAAVAAYAQLDDNDLQTALNYVPGAGAGATTANGGGQPAFGARPGGFQPNQGAQQPGAGGASAPAAYDPQALQQALMPAINQIQREYVALGNMQREVDARHFELYGRPVPNPTAIVAYAEANGVTYEAAWRQVHNVSAREAEVQTAAQAAQREQIRQELLAEQALQRPNPALPTPQFHEAHVLQGFIPSQPGLAEGQERTGSQARQAIATNALMQKVAARNTAAGGNLPQQ